MDKLYRWLSKYREMVLASIDVMIIITSYLLAYYIRTDYGRTSYRLIFNPLVNNMIFVVACNLCSIIAFRINRSLWRYISIDEAFRVVLAVFCGNATWLLIVIFLHIPEYIRSLPLIAGFIQMSMMLGLRLLYRKIRRDSMQNKRKHRAIILGAGSSGAMALREITYSDLYDTKVIGFLDKNERKVKKVLNGVAVLGTDEDLQRVVETYQIDTAFIAIKNIQKEDLKQLIEKCRDLNLRTKIVSFELHDGFSRSKIRNVNIDDLLGRGELHLNMGELNDFLAGKCVVVTGAGGSIGSELVRQMLQFRPKQLVLIDIYENTMYELQQEIRIQMRLHEQHPELDVVCLIASVRDQKRIQQIFQQYQPQIVFHAAAHKHVPLVEDSPLEAIKNNVFGTKNVIEASILTHVEKFVLISTDKAVRTTNVMGATKRMCELLVEGYKNNGVTKLCAVRFGNVLGSHGSVIPLFEKQIEAGGPVTVTDPRITRYFMTIPEAAQLVLQAGAYAQSGEIFILDMGKPVQIVDLAKNLILLSGYQPGRDIEIIYTGLRPGEKLYEELLIDPKMVNKTKNNLIYIAQPEEVDCRQVQEKLQKLQGFIDHQVEDNKQIIEVINQKGEQHG